MFELVDELRVAAIPRVRDGRIGTAGANARGLTFRSRGRGDSRRAMVLVEVVRVRGFVDARVMVWLEGDVDGKAGL